MKIHPDLVALLTDCWSENPEIRPSIRRVRLNTEMVLKTYVQRSFPSDFISGPSGSFAKKHINKPCKQGFLLFHLAVPVIVPWEQDQNNYSAKAAEQEFCSSSVPVKRTRRKKWNRTKGNPTCKLRISVFSQTPENHTIKAQMVLADLSRHHLGLTASSGYGFGHMLHRVSLFKCWARFPKNAQWPSSLVGRAYSAARQTRDDASLERCVRLVLLELDVVGYLKYRVCRSCSSVSDAWSVP